MEKRNSAIIIGAGLSGLECGYILAKSGMDVTVLEHGKQIGGCIQSFRRGSALFDTGFHYIGGLGEGESLHPLFKYFNLLHLPWHKLDEDCFDEVFIGDRSYPFANGHARFVERLSEYFPKERKNLEAYADLLKKVGDHIFDAFEPRSSMDFYSTSLFARSAHEFLEETVTDPLLRTVLSGTSLKMELKADSLPLYIFAQINNSFIQSAWRLAGGGSQIADSLAADIRKMGGKVLTGATVTEMKEEEGRITSVTVNGEERYTADWIISSSHPASTLGLIKESRLLKKIYRKRVSNLANTFGMFTANIRLKEKALPYLNRNLFLHQEGADLWNVRPEAPESLLVSYGVPSDKGASAETLDLLFPMSWAQVAPWADQEWGHRDAAYQEMKEENARKGIKFAAKYIQGLEKAIDKIYTSTPLTYNSYTLSPEGTAYGIRKDCQNTMTTIMAPRTPIGNLLLTGQNLNLHGILGVSMTSVMSSAVILGMDTLKNEIFK